MTSARPCDFREAGTVERFDKKADTSSLTVTPAHLRSSLNTPNFNPFKRELQDHAESALAAVVLS
jgi:hypothetical protein